jgi:spore germination protein KC
MAEGINPVINAVENTGEGDMPERTEVLRKSEGYEKLKFTGLGAFSDDKLVGWLNEAESKGCGYIIGAVERSIEYASKDGSEVSFEILKAKSRIKASVENNAPRSTWR